MGRLKYANPFGNFLICLNYIAKALAETVFVQFLFGRFIPNTATIRRKLITQHNAVMKHAKFQFKIYQHQVARLKQTA